MKKRTQEDRNILLFMLLGDGTIDKDGRFQIKHCEKQKEYLEWKRKLLSSFLRISEITKKIDKVPYKEEIREYTNFYIRTRREKFLKSYRKILYSQGKKQVFTEKILKKLTPLALAIWYMDDGSIANAKDKNGIVQRSQLVFNIYRSFEECQLIVDYFKDRWNIRFGIYKHKGKYIIRCNTVQAREFIKIIEKYVNEISCMKYKINVKPETERSFKLGEARECRTLNLVEKENILN